MTATYSPLENRSYIDISYNMNKNLIHIFFGLLECPFPLCLVQNPLLCSYAFLFIILICKGSPLTEKFSKPIGSLKRVSKRAWKKKKREDTENNKRGHHKETMFLNLHRYIWGNHSRSLVYCCFLWI